MGVRRRAPASPAPLPARSGLLVVDKPAGPTSHDVVARVRRALGAPGAGHLGTLDPSATGLLLVAIGAATRCIALWQGGEKTYEAVLRFGVETASHDLDGEVVATSDRLPNVAAVREASLPFVGELQQVPPMVSAIKVGGKRLHELARAGVTVERAPRTVHVADWTWLEFEGADARAVIRCSGGTYIRALARDLGRALGCGATLASLRRLRSEPFGLDRAVSMDDLARESAETLWERGGIPLRDALASRPGFTLTDEERRRIAHGQPITRGEDAPGAGADAGEWRVLRDPDGEPLAIAECARHAHGPARISAQPRIVFPWVAGTAS